MSPSPSFPDYQQAAAQQQMNRASAVERAEHPYVVAAQRWTGAKQRLDAARAAADQISRELTEATLVERESWDALTNAAERGEKLEARPAIDMFVPTGPVRR
jgi:hypothetical protein